MKLEIEKKKIARIVRDVKKIMKKWDCESFLFGCKLPEEIEILEEAGWGKKLPREAIKTRINRILSKEVERKTRFVANRDNPDIIFTYDIENNTLEFDVRPVYVFGKYLKKKKPIRQTKKGDMASVEGIIEEIVKKKCGAKKVVLHGAGREDIDVLMLGEGRPFVMEIVKPKKRKIDLKSVENEINKTGVVEVKKLKMTTREMVEIIKRARFDKTYMAIVNFQKERPDVKKLEDYVKRINRIGEIVINQRTPTRVLRRRADIIRKRKIKKIKAEVEDGKLIIVMKTESGTYIKEFISGDNGRTKPSISSILGTNAECSELNVLKVHSEWLEDWW